jgi:hypothetical protein
MKKAFGALALATLSFACVNASADMVKLNGFLTAAATYGSNELDTPYLYELATDSLELDTYDNRLGLQVSARINDKSTLTALLLARGGSSNYDVNADWAYVNYQISNKVDVRLGKYKIPQFLVSDYANVGYAYPWVRPPRDVYSTNPLVSLGGADLFVRQPFGNLNVLLEVFAGSGTHQTFIPARTIDFLQQTSAYSTVQKGKAEDFETNRTIGYNLAFKYKFLNFRVGHFRTEIDAPFFQISDAPTTFTGLGLSLDVNNIIVFAEAISRDANPDLAIIFPDQIAWYTTLGYRFSNFLPTITFSRIDEGTDSSILAVKQSSVALGMRYEIANSAALKFEALYAKPDEGNHGLFYEPVDSGMVYTISYDTIF